MKIYAMVAGPDCLRSVQVELHGGLPELARLVATVREGSTVALYEGVGFLGRLRVTKAVQRAAVRMVRAEWEKEAA